VSGAPRNVAASVRARLLSLAKERGEDFQYVLMRYAGDRLLYRLGISPHRDRFILKGARLFALWTGEMHRPTRDLDFLGYGRPDVNLLIGLFQEICIADLSNQDGLTFPGDAIAGVSAREDQDYEGASLRLTARLGSAVIPLQLDFGFGDAVTLTAELSEFPTLLVEQPPPVVRTYPRETVVAEKFQVMVSLGMANSRMKDFYDLWYLARRFEFDGALLALALAATFERRKTPLSSAEPVALTPEFHNDPAKQSQWTAFVRRSRLQGDGTELVEVTELIRAFLMPPALAALASETYGQLWLPHGGWGPG
jgi:predicted nucleotidyltransferase component of viral defense system